VRRRDGFTLVETIIAVVILSLLVLIGLPRMSSAMAQNELRGARTSMINMVAAARAASVQSNRLTWVKFVGNTAHVLARPRLIAAGGFGVNPPDTVGTVQNFADVYGVTVAPEVGVDSIQFDPRGFGAGFGDTTAIVLTRAGHSSTITIDGLGRVRK
jgi:prepilin-type N-terminal cleavage/methylation domain-containing protein